MYGEKILIFLRLLVQTGAFWARWFQNYGFFKIKIFSKKGSEKYLKYLGVFENGTRACLRPLVGRSVRPLVHYGLVLACLLVTFDDFWVASYDFVRSILARIFRPPVNL